MAGRVAASRQRHNREIALEVAHLLLDQPALGHVLEAEVLDCLVKDAAVFQARIEVQEDSTEPDGRAIRGRHELDAGRRQHRCAG